MASIFEYCIIWQAIFTNDTLTFLFNITTYYEYMNTNDVT